MSELVPLDELDVLELGLRVAIYRTLPAWRAEELVWAWHRLRPAARRRWYESAH